MIINKENDKIKYLKENISLNKYLSFKYSIKSDIQGDEVSDYIWLDFSSMVERSEEAKNKLRWRLLPNLFKEEIKEIISSQFNGNKEEYFKTIQIYFDKFSINDLIDANLTRDKIKIKEARIQKLGQSVKTLRRKLQNKRKAALWHAQSLLRLAGKGGTDYCSKTLINDFKIIKSKEQEFIKNSVVIGTDKKVIQLEKATKTSEQNIAEKINLIKTIEQIAENKGFSWCFITLTLDGEYHPNPSVGKNTYNGISPKESAKMLNNKIVKTRTYLANKGIKAGRDYLGCATAEAHKDGCLHKHLLIYCKEENFDKIRQGFEFHFPNLNNQSFIINNGQAKASSYVFKYVMKSINHFDKDFDIMSFKKEDDEAKYNAILNNAFRSFNNIRGFSFFGIENCMTKFRFLGRNYKNMNLPSDIEELIKNNDLYGLIKQGFFSMLDNIYMKKDEKNQFIGCNFNGLKYIKRFFNLVKNALKLNEEEINNSCLVAEEKTRKVLEYIVNPNYSSKTQSVSKSKKEVVKIPILNNPFEFNYMFV